MKKILVADAVHPILIENFEQAGYACVLKPSIRQQEVLEEIEIYYGIIINSKTKMYKEALDKAKNLKFIGRLGSGMEIIDVPYATQKGIQCFSVPEGNSNAVAEHALAMLLALFNKIPQADAEVRQFVWNREKNRGEELAGKTVGIIGYGNTGKAFAKKLSGLDVKVLAYDKYLNDFSDSYVKEVTMEVVFEEADILSFHVPLTKETKYLCDKAFIQKFKKDIYLINTSRGAVLKLEELFFHFSSKKIKGACLDVFENEKPQTYTIQEKEMYQKLHTLNAVILSPHVAGWTVESKFKIGDLLSKKIINTVK